MYNQLHTTLHAHAAYAEVPFGLWPMVIARGCHFRMAPVMIAEKHKLFFFFSFSYAEGLLALCLCVGTEAG